MAQGMMLRGPSSANAATASRSRLTTRNRNSFEEKLMLFQLFDRHERNNSPSTSTDVEHSASNLLDSIFIEGKVNIKGVSKLKDCYRLFKKHVTYVIHSF